MSLIKKMLTKQSSYSLRKSTHLLRQVYHLFQRKKTKLSSKDAENLSEQLLELQDAILCKDREKASSCAKKLELMQKQYLKKTSFEQSRDFVIAMGIALCVAVLIRQMWFEFYEIPTGSMRPTLKEKDRLVVSKTPFGINIPITPRQFCFFPSLVERNGIVVFTGENMDIRDVDTKYFYIFPGKKQYIKRLIGKPGDTLYFYGGKIYGIDAEGNDISKELQNPNLDQIEHIPFIHFEGKTITPSSSQGVYTPVILRQMNEAVARLSMTNQYQLIGEMLPNHAETHRKYPPIKDYGDLWGIKNFGMARLLTKEQLKQISEETNTLPEAPLYLEIRHHPSLKDLKLSRDERGRLRPMLNLSSSYLPLEKEHLETLFRSLYTARFVVKNGFVHRYGLSSASQKMFFPKLSGVPDGTYEFYYGKAYQVFWQGIAKELPLSHPLYECTPERVQLFYNLGIEFDTRFSPQTKGQTIFPSRYVYYRFGSLYAMGSVLLEQNDPTLVEFLHREYQKQATSLPLAPYVPFEDLGPPLKEDGSINIPFIQQNGLFLPAHSYLVLGDNHAMSADSRDFGLVPEENLRGAPDWIFWPPGARWGTPNQPDYPFFNTPRTIIWILAGISIGGYLLYRRRRNRLPLLIRHEKKL